jgi:hypothetical protein
MTFPEEGTLHPLKDLHPLKGSEQRPMPQKHPKSKTWNEGQC